MNHLYRRIFNRALGLWQVASELARSPRGLGVTGGGGIAAAGVRPVSFALWVALGFVTTLPAFAQVTADPHASGNQRPTVLGSPGSAALINIQTPSAAGVSRNTYSQFDVDAHGAVLNNSRTATQSQLAGAIGGNPWLATGTAKIILNEVSGSAPSQLNGYVEVAGDRAQVIIANPAGIACDGCGFLNASRVTLTTGSPVLSGGALDGYRVTGGAIQVNGKGLDASHADYTDIIARAVAVNGGIWSPQLQVTTGANQVSADHAQITSIAGTGAAPRFALDVSALGGMYANKIQLLGTEHGLGVRNAGSIGAQAGDLVVTVDGRLENTGALQAQGDAHLVADGGVANAGTLSATRELTITTPADMDNSHGTLNAGRIAVDAGSLRNAGGTIAQTGAQAMALQAGAVSNREGGRIGFPDSGTDGGTDGGTDISGSGSGDMASAPPSGNGESSADGGDTGPDSPVSPIAPLADGVLHIAGLLDNDGGRISAASGFDLATDRGLANDGGQLELRQLTLTHGDLSNRDGELVIDGAATIHAGNVTNDGGRLSFAKTLTFDAQNLSNRGGTLTQAGTDATALSVAGTLDNSDGTLASNASSLTITSGTLINTGGTLSHAGADGLTIRTGTLQGAGGTIATAGAVTLAAGAIDHRGATLSATQLALTADSLDNRGGTIATSGDPASTLTVAGTLDNGEGGTLASNGDLTIQAGVLGNANGTVQHAGDGTLRIDAATVHGAGGTIGSNGQLLLTGAATDLSGGTTSAQAIRITAGTLSTAGGVLTATGSDALTLDVDGAYDNTQGQVSTNGALQLQAQSLANAGGTLAAAGAEATTVQVADRFDNTGGSVGAMGATTVHAGTLVNRGGTVQAAGAPLTVSADGLLDNSQHGTLASDGDLAITAATLDNTQGSIAHAGSGTLRIDASTLDGAGGTIASNGALHLRGDATNLRDGATTAQTVTIATGTLTTAGGTLQALGDGPLVLTVRGAFDNTAGTVATNGALQLQAASFDNTGGTVTAAGTEPTRIDVTGTVDNTAGTLATAGATTVHAGALVNQGGTVQAASTAPLTLTIDGLLGNDQGTLESNGAIDLTAARLSNHGGTIQTQQAIAAAVTGTLDNTDGQIHAGDALTLSSARLTNAGGTIDGVGAVSIDATTLDNTGGELVQRGAGGSLQLTVADAASNAQAGLIGADGRATVHAGALDNTGGTVVAQDGLDLASGGDVINRDGGLLQGAELALTAGGALDNTGGTLDASGAATVTAARIDNTNGQLLAGAADDPDAALTLTATGALDNRGGTLGSRGGDTTLHAATIDNRDGGVLVAQRDLTLDTAAVNNAGGTVYATGNLDYENTAGTLDNARGQFGAGETARLTLASVDDTAGGRVQAGTLWLSTPMLAIDGGTVAADTLHADLTALTGIGRLYGAQELDATFRGDYIHQAGQRLESDGRLALAVAGTFTNQGTLETAGELDVEAANVINQGTLNASNAAGTGLARITATGDIDNQAGASIEGDTLTLAATDISNTGDILGDHVRIDADTLTNGADLGDADDPADPYGTATIGAAQDLQLDLRDRLTNQNARIFSQGNLVIGGSSARDAAGRPVQLTGEVINRTGTIEADGDLAIAATQLSNERRVFEVETVALTPAEQAANSTSATVVRYRYDDPDPLHHPPYVDESQLVSAEEIAAADAYCTSHMGDVGGRGERCMGYPYGAGSADHFEAVQTDTVTSVERLQRASAASVISAGGDLDLTGNVRNVVSTITANGTLTINGGAYDGAADSTVDGYRVQNLAWAPSITVTRTNALTVGWERETKDNPTGCAPINGKDRCWLPQPYKDYTTYYPTGADGGSLTLLLTPDQTPDWLTLDPGPSLASTLAGSAGVAVHGGDVTNGYVGADGQPTPITTGGLRGPGSTSLGAGADAGAVDAVHAATSGGAVAHGTVQGAGNAQLIGTPEHPLPGLVPPASGAVIQHADPGAPFLVTTAPRFAQGASTSSDYLLRALGTDPNNLHKRLGDGYVEQNLVMDQILQLTGRRSVNGGDGATSYQALMDGAAAQASRLGLALGAPLTTAQIGALDTDIVWLVDQVVDGQHVLVPVVYLSKASADRLAQDGALIAGDTVEVEAAGTVHNDGTLSAAQGLWLSADTLINDGAMHGGERLDIATRGDTVNRGAMSGGTVAIAAGGDVVNAVHADGLDTHGGVIAAGTGGVQLVAGRDLVQDGRLTSAGDGMLVAGRDLSATASTTQIAGNGTLVAGRDLTLGATGHTTTTRGANGDSADSTTHTVARLTTGGSLAVAAGRDLTGEGAALSAGTRLGVSAGRDLRLGAVTDVQSGVVHTHEGKTQVTTSTRDETLRGSTLSGADGVTVSAGHDATLTAATITSDDGDVALAAGNNLTLAAGQETHSETVDTQRHHSGLLSSTTTTTHDAVSDTYAVGTTISGAQGVVLSASQDINAVAANVSSSDGAVIAHADRDINVLAGQNTHSETVDSSTTQKGFLTKKETTTHDAVEDTTAVGTTFSGKTGVAVDAGRNVLGVGATLQSRAGGIVVSAGDQVAFLAATDTHNTEHSDKVRRSGIEWVPNPKQGTQKQTVVTSQLTAVGSTLDAVGPIVVTSDGNQTYQAATLHSGTGTALVSGGAINFVTATNSDTYQRDSGKHNVAYQSQDHRLQVDTTEVQTQITGPVAISAADGITVGVGQKEGETQEQAIARASQSADTAWLADLQGQPNVSWQSVDEQHLAMHQHHEGLTAAAAAVVVVAATVLTAGAASAAVGSAAGATAGSGTAFAAAGAGTAAGVGNAIVTGVIVGAAGGGVSAGVQGNDWKQGALSGAVSGGISAGLFYGAGSLGQANSWANGSWQKVGLHMAAGGTSNALTGGNFWNGALSAGFAEGTSPYMQNLPGGSAGQAAGAAVSGAAGAWLGGGDVGQGALTGLSGYLFNRAMHPAETAAVDKLSAEGGDHNQLKTVACNETKCWEGSGLGVMGGVTQAQVDAIVQAMSPEQYQAALAQLKQAAPGEFNYSTGDALSDYWKENNVGTRLAGTVQWLGGGLQAAGAALSAPALCATGAGCVGAGYLWTSAWDNANAGAYAMVNGAYTPTWGGQAFQYLGLSPGTAELTYGLTQLSPMAYEAYVANKATNAWVLANADARASYAATNSGATGTVWDSITATQPNYPGSVIPQSFEMSLPNGQSVWVHGNATEHMAEYAQMTANNNAPNVVQLTTQQQLSSLQSAVNTATQGGVPYNQLINVSGWELKFAPPRQPGQLPALIHALPISK